MKELKNIEIICHSAIRIQGENKVIYIDPFGLKEEKQDADIIFITHSHYDHFSEEDIEKVRKSDTVIIVPEETKLKAIKMNFSTEYIVEVKPEQSYQVEGISFITIPAYNIDKPFHPKENGWVGYLLKLEGMMYYIAGDTDRIEENRNVKCDIAFLPIGGTYTMNAKEAAGLANEIKPKIVIPIHYGSIVGTKQDAVQFGYELDPKIQCQTLIEC